MSVEHHHLPAHLRVEVDHPLFLVLTQHDVRDKMTRSEVRIIIFKTPDSHLVSDDDECFLRGSWRMPGHAGWLTSLLHLAPVFQTQTPADAAALQVELVDLHVLTEGDEDPSGGLGVRAVHHLQYRPAVSLVAAQELPLREKFVLFVDGDTAISVGRGQELPAGTEQTGPDAALAVGEGE